MPNIEELSTTTVSDDENFLAEGENEVEAPAKSTEEAPKETAEKPEEKSEETVEEKPEEKPEVSTAPLIHRLGEKYPGIFKDFPELRKLYYGHEEYTKLFPTLEDAREVLESAENFNNLRDQILDGKADILLDSVKAADEKSLTRLATNFLPSLLKTSPDLHLQVVTPVAENIVRAIYNSGVQRNDDNMKNAALHAALFLFNDAEVATGKRTVSNRVEEPKEDPRIAEIEGRQLSTFTGEVAGEAERSLRGIISDRLDPDKVLTDFTKKSLINEILSEVRNQMTADKDHMKGMNRLWDGAKKAGFTGDSKAKIINAYLARARSLVPAIRSKLLTEALGTSPKASEASRDKARANASRREPGSSGSASRVGGNGYVDPKKVDWSKTSDADFLDGENIVLKN